MYSIRSQGAAVSGKRVMVSSWNQWPFLPTERSKQQCLSIALMFLLKRENHKGAAEVNTIPVMTTTLHGQRRILCLLYTHLWKFNALHRIYFWEGEDPFHQRKMGNFASPELGNHVAVGLRVSRTWHRSGTKLRLHKNGYSCSSL